MSFAQPNKLQGPEVTKAEEVVKPSVCELIALARRIGEVRNARKEILPAGQFGEPGWDMMLALYLASIRGEFLTVTNVCDASDAPPTTALRWLDRLLELKMVRRRKHPTDARMVYIELEPHSSELVESFLRRAWSTFYPPV